MSDPDLDLEKKPSRRLWIFAALAALVLHIGGAALAFAHLRTDESDDSLGTPAIEVGLEMTSPHDETTELPPGPDTDASVASPALAEQKAEVKETELPKEVPTETSDPDRVVTPNDAQKPKEDDSKVAKVQTMASRESVAAEATAMPSSEAAPEGPRSVAPVQGVGKALQRLKVSWFAELTAHFDRHKRNPDVQKFKKAKVVVNVTFDRTGHIVASKVEESSGDPAYDEAALAMVRRSDPVPKPPPLVADEGLNFNLPVIFKDRS
jgi:TonB family protein